MKTDLMTVLNSTTVQKANGNTFGNSQAAGTSYSFGSVDFSSLLSALDATKNDHDSDTDSAQASSDSSSTSTSSDTSATDTSATDGSGSASSGLSTADFVSLLQSGMLNNFGAQVSSMNSTFASDLTSALNNAGIDTSGPITLVTGSDGKVHVAGDNPNASAIEGVLAGNQDLTQEYYDVSDANSLARSLRGVGQYAKQQAQSGGDAANGDLSSLWNSLGGAANTMMPGSMMPGSMMPGGFAADGGMTIAAQQALQQLA